MKKNIFEIASRVAKERGFVSFVFIANQGQSIGVEFSYAGTYIQEEVYFDTASLIRMSDHDVQEALHLMADRLRRKMEYGKLSFTQRLRNALAEAFILPRKPITYIYGEAV